MSRAKKMGIVVAGRQTQGVPDQELLARFLHQRDEAAFAALMERHGSMVLGVCRRMLRNVHDAEDACQAVFLVLARKAEAVRKQGSLSSWLHGVAWRVANKLRARLARRHASDAASAADKPTVHEPADLTWRELLHVLDEELNRLPAAYRGPLVLCHLEGRTQDEAARELGWSLGTLRGRLERGRHKLRARLLRRGISGSAVLAVASLAPGVCGAAVPATLVVATVNASVAMSRGALLPATIPAHVAALACEVATASALSGWTSVLIASILALVLGALAAAFRQNPDEPAPAPDQVGLVPGWHALRRLEGHTPRVWCVAFAPDGRQLATGAEGLLGKPGALRLCDVATGEVLVTLPTPQSVRSIAYAPDGKTLATAEHDGSARLRDATTGAVLQVFAGHQSMIDAVSFSADGTRLVTSGQDKAVKVWNSATGGALHTLLGHKGQVFAAAFGAGDTVASGGLDRTVRLWDAATGAEKRALRGHQNIVHWVAFSPDGETVASASWDRTVKLWTTATGQLRATLRGHTEPVLHVAFAPDGQSLASCSSRWAEKTLPHDKPSPGEVIVWDLKTHEPSARWRDAHDRILGVAFSPDGQLLASAGWDGSVTLWQRGLVQPAVALPSARQTGPERAYSLQGDSLPAELEPIGPGARTCVRVEPQGLRVALPTGFKGERPITGVCLGVGSAGDFDVSVGYEILAEPVAEDANRPTKLALAAVLERADWAITRLARRVSPRLGPRFSTFVIRNNHEGSGKRQSKYREFPAEAKVGRLRIARVDSEFLFYTAEGPQAPWTLLHKVPAGTENLRQIEVGGSTGGPLATLDVRFTDLRVRIGKANEPQPETSPEPTRAPRTWVLTVTVLGFALGASMLLAAYVYRQRRAPPS
jgi:RNA polymerase sigma factor (sigma-70 family)